MLKLPSIFSDNMVLQQGKEITVWGESWALKVTAELIMGEKSIVSTAYADNGKFKVRLPEQTAGGPYILKVYEGMKSDTGVTFEDVYIGEVFLAGGQSNMEWELQSVTDGENEVKRANNDKVRYYYTPKVSWVGNELKEAEENSKWEICSPDTAARWSAIAYYFACELADKLGVMVGIIGCNWGGTSASCWVSRETLSSNSALKPYIDDYDNAVINLDMDEYLKELDEYNSYQPKFDKRLQEYYATAENPNWDEAIKVCGESKYPGPIGPRLFSRPCGLYESMLLRVAPYTIRAFLFYQGEQDDIRPYTYKELLSALIKEWRTLWGDNSLPFLNVQLSGYNNEFDYDIMCWSFIREAQLDLCLEIDNYAMAVSVDIGEKRNIHPLNKKPVGLRLAYLALAYIYDKMQRIDAEPPMYRECEIKGDRICCHFDNAENGFVIKAADGEAMFEVAGEDKKYYPASASIEKENDAYVIILRSDDVPAPQYARYAWRNFPTAILYGANNLPVSPFRTSKEDGARALCSSNGDAIV